MRATFAGLNTMVRGIMSNQMGLDTTGHNITNAGTEGYSRQTITLATTYAEKRSSAHGEVMVGTGVDALAVNRARNAYADLQYRNENPTQQYYKTASVNYDRLETIFDDSRDLGIEKSLTRFYQTWVDLSTTASNAASRTQVIEQGRELSDRIQAATADLQDQIRSEYVDLHTEIGQIDDILEEIRLFNKQIVTQEVGGSQANDLRDRRDLLVDKLSDYLNISVTENDFGAYQINSGGVTLVNGNSRAHLIMSEGVSSEVYGIDYGVTDYNIKVQESNIVFIPQNGILKARLDAISEDKKYIDQLSNLSSFMLSTFNDQHKQGFDLDGNAGMNFYGQGSITYEYRYDPETGFNYLYKNDPSETFEEDKLLSGVRIIEALEVNVKFNDNKGNRYLAATTSKKQNPDGEWVDFAWANRTGDGTNAVYMSELFNISQESILEDNKANALVYKKAILRDKDGNPIDENGNLITDSSKYVYATPMAKLSINAYYQDSMSYLGINAYSTDVNYEALQNIITQVQNWRDAMSGVDWNEELTNMIRYHKGFGSCSRCLNAMDEMLDKLVNSTGVVGR